MDKLWRWDWLLAYLVGTTVVLVGVLIGRQFVAPHPRLKNLDEPFLSSLIHWDSHNYLLIARDGYVYEPDRQSRLFFMPGYPMTGKIVSILTGIPVHVTLVVLSHVLFAGALFLAAKYAVLRFEPDDNGRRLAMLMSMTFMPAGLFFRMAYSESLFLFLTVLELYLIERRANPIWVAVVAGFGSGVRVVGIALALPVLWYVYQTKPGRVRQLAWVCLCLPLSFWGVLGFMIYCQAAFGDALGFARNNVTLWQIRATPPLDQKVFALLAFEPVWSILLPESPNYFGLRSANYSSQPLFNFYLANPLFFVAALVLLVLGLYRDWLNGYEALVTLALLGIPYWIKGYENNMVGMARYVSVVFPLYLVAGRLLATASIVTKASFLLGSSILLAGYSALFARYYGVY